MLTARLLYTVGATLFHYTCLTKISVEAHQKKALKASITKPVAFWGEYKTPKTEESFNWCTGWWWCIIAIFSILGIFFHVLGNWCRLSMTGSELK